MHPKAIIVCAVALVALGVFASLRLAGKPNNHGKKYSVYKFGAGASLPFDADSALVYVNHDYAPASLQEQLDHTDGPDGTLDTTMPEDWNEGYVEAVVGNTRYVVATTFETYQEFVDDTMVDCWKYVTSDFAGDVDVYAQVAAAAETLEFVEGTNSPPAGTTLNLAECMEAAGKGERVRRELLEEQELIAQHIVDNHVLTEGGALIGHKAADRRLGEGAHKRMLRPSCSAAREYAKAAYDATAGAQNTWNFGENRCYRPENGVVAISGSDDDQLTGAKAGITFRTLGCSGCSWRGCSGCSLSHEHSLGGSQRNDWYCNLWANQADGNVKACYGEYARRSHEHSNCGNRQKVATCTGHSLGGGSCAVGQAKGYWDYAMGFNPVPAIKSSKSISGHRYIYRKDVASQCGYSCATRKIAQGSISLNIRLPGWLNALTHFGNLDVKSAVKHVGNQWFWGYESGSRVSHGIGRSDNFGRNDCVDYHGRAKGFDYGECDRGGTWDIIFGLAGSFIYDAITTWGTEYNTASDHSNLNHICR